MVTLEDIARKAGVSHSTVSRALADSPLINPETKKRIQQLADEAGYQVNQVARNLKVRSTRTIGLVVPEVSNPFYPRIIQLVADRVREAGYNLQLHLSGAEQESEVASLASLREHRADGILLVTGEHGLVAKEQVSKMIRSGLPIVLMGWVEGADQIDMVTGNDASGGYELGRHLVDLGHRRIAVIGKPPHRGVYDRMLGFRRALEESSVDLPENVVLPARDGHQVRDCVHQLLALAEPPTAIFAYQDSLAALVYKHLDEAGISIPRDMTVVGFDDLDLATYISPHLTTVGLHTEPLASEFVRLLLERIRSKASDAAAQHVVISPRIVVRASSAPPRGTSLVQTHEART